MGTLNINSQTYNLNPDLEKAFMRGSAWSNLYIPYKFEVTNIKEESIAEQILLLIQIYSFISTELNYFIATHSDNTEAKNALKQVNNERKKMIDYFETNYYTLSNWSAIDNYNYFKGDNNVEI